MQVKNIIDSVKGFRFIVEKLDLKSGLGKRFLLNQTFLKDKEVLEIEFNNIEQFINLSNRYPEVIATIQQKLEHVKDINGTIRNLSNAATLDDIELFEVKYFALLASEISLILGNANIKALQIPDLNEVVKILDPENLRIPSFYIHSLYSQELASLRLKYNKLKAENSEGAEEVRLQCLEVEDKIRHDLSLQLFEYSKELSFALDKIAYLDVLIAKALQSIDLSLTKPVVSEDKTNYFGLFNPQVREVLAKENKEFQPVDISLYSLPCLITGANMGGKTVLLKSVALAQYMFQFGFYVPAKKADITLVDKVMLSMGDDQSELTGLSSFASEMLNLNEILKVVKSGKSVLALIDELARTTNPEEGKAIVNATIDLFDKYQVRSLITTHYSGLNANCRKLKVKGLAIDKLNSAITIENINNFMDYSLVENKDEDSSTDAIAIARILGVDEELLNRIDII